MQRRDQRKRERAARKLGMRDIATDVEGLGRDFVHELYTAYCKDNREAQSEALDRKISELVRNGCKGLFVFVCVFDCSL